MAKVNPLSFAFHINEDDLYPPIRVKIYSNDTGDPFDLTDYTGEFFMAPTSDKSSPKISAGTVNITDATEGEAQYEWQSGDTDTSDQYFYQFRFTESGRTFTVPAVSPGIVHVETKIGS